MRVVIVWVTALTLLFSVSVGWYICLPVTYGLSAAIEDAVASLPVALQTLRIVEYIVLLWGPVWDAFILIWAFLESHRIIYTSQMYGGQ